jgi:hypothetical protein
MIYPKCKAIIGIPFVVLFILLPLEAGAQNIEVGVRYNPEFTGLINKNDMTAGSALQRTGNFAYTGSFGAGAVLNINKHFGLAVDFLFSREGQRFEGYLGSNPSDASTYGSVVNTQVVLNHLSVVGDYVAKAELNYFKLPLMISLTSDNTRPLFFTLLIGPQVDFLQGVAQEVNHTDETYPNTDITPYDLYKPITINGVLALGGACNISSRLVLSARVRGDYGFEDVENKEVMVRYNGAAPVRFYSPERGATHCITGGLMIGLDYKI